jgi:hypothetical protein
MAIHDNGTTEPTPEFDLDRMIGELETESARRRADPGYPHDADARLHFELARQAPNPWRPPTAEALVDRIEETASARPGSAPGAEIESMGSRRRRPQVVARYVEGVDRRVASLGLAVAAAMRAVTGRLGQLEERVRRLEPEHTLPTLPPPVPGGSDTLARWKDRLAESLPLGERVLYAESEADEVVGWLRSAGVDAYGVTSLGSPDRPGPDIRFADLFDHLRAVGDGALGVMLLVGVPEVMRPESIGPLVSEMRRVTKVAVVISEAQWWWRQRLGAVHADLAPGRPLDSDTWLDAFHRVGMDGSVEYDATGRSYRVVARARP